MANEKIDGQDRVNQYDDEEYEDSSLSSTSEEDKNEPNGPCEMGLTDPYPWADKGQAQLV